MHLSVVIPFHNEELSLPALSLELEAALAGLPGGWEAVFVDDGSTDGSARAVERLGRAWARLERLPRRGGRAAAVRRGLERAHGELVALLDADLQYDPADLLRVREALLAGADVALGERVRRRDPCWRRAGSRALNALLRAISGLPARDAFCGLQGCRREAALRLERERPGSARHLALRAHAAGLKVVGVPVAHRDRSEGGSRYGLARLLALAAGDLAAALRCRLT